MIDPKNIYYQARMRAAEKNTAFASRERTAGVIYVSAEALADYESGITIPGCDVVQKMVEGYGDPDLKAAHIRSCCPLLPDYGGNRTSELASAALGWAVAFQSAQEIAVQFAAVARDGKISSDEMTAVKVIRQKAVELRRVMEETVTAIDKAIGELHDAENNP